MSKVRGFAFGEVKAWTRVGTSKDEAIGKITKTREDLFVQIEWECDEARRGGNGFCALG